MKTTIFLTLTIIILTTELALNLHNSRIDQDNIVTLAEMQINRMAHIMTVERQYNRKNDADHMQLLIYLGKLLSERIKQLPAVACPPLGSDQRYHTLLFRDVNTSWSAALVATDNSPIYLHKNGYVGVDKSCYLDPEINHYVSSSIFKF